MAGADPIAVELVYCPAPGQIDRVCLQLPPGTTAAQALQASGLLDRHDFVLSQLRLGIWGKPKSMEQVLRERDRIEIYRPLKVDPKEARRQRYQQHKDSQAARRR
jgi:putative ubiquitin-RnfH superfamily antitoxin RatB of RatAB toxin-antitoxin module